MRFIYILSFLACFSNAVTAQKPSRKIGQHRLVVGTYTSGTSKGLYSFTFSSNTGKAVPLNNVITPNPSFVTIDAAGKFVYAVNELNGGKGKVNSFAFNKNTGGFRFINQQATQGDDPCYVSIDKTGKWVVVGNYSGGNFSIFPLKQGGKIGPAIRTIQHTGTGANVIRQEKAHVHCTMFSPDNKFLLVADLGTNKLISYSFNAKNGAIKPADSVEVAAGAGPRHIAFHPKLDILYLTEELTATVTAFSYDKGHLVKTHTYSLLEDDFQGTFSAADIHISTDGKFLYASNRGTANTISIFSISKDGSLELVEHQPVLGTTPRNFSIDPSGKFLLVANQDSDEIVVFSRDTASGILSDTGERIKVSKPVCLVWVK